jgi:hypothetical protein
LGTTTPGRGRRSTEIQRVARKLPRATTISRSVDNPSEVFVRVEFASVDEAKSFRERLLGSGALDNVDVKMPPTVVEVADEATY